MKNIDKTTLAIMASELGGLTKNPINGWNTIYPTLYTNLHAIIADLAEKLNCPTPGLFIPFQGIQSYQASCQLMLDGSAQLHLGANFINKFLFSFNLPPEKSDDLYRAFRWTITHELSHLCDPTFKLYGKMYPIRKAMANIATFLFFFVLITLIIGSQPTWLQWLTLPIFVLISTALLVLEKNITILLHRKFEYNADAKSMSIEDIFNPNDAQLGLIEMSTDIKTFLRTHYGTWRKKYISIKISQLHPSIKNRIAFMKSLLPDQ